MKVLLTATSWFLNLLPRFLRVRLGRTIGYVWFYLIRFRRDVVTANLELAFGDRLTQREIRELARDNFCHYGQTLVETLASLTWSRERLLEEIQIDGLHHVKRLTDAGKGLYILTLHMGNWELAVASVVASGVPFDIVVKRAKSPFAENLLSWFRKKTGPGIIVEEGTAKDILRSVSQGRAVGFMLDQFMGPPIGLPVHFFGKLAGTAAALSLLTEKRDTPVIPAHCFRDGAGRLRVVFDSPLVFPQLPDSKEERLFVKTQKYNDCLQQMVENHPGQWLWLHRRWKAYNGAPKWAVQSALVGLVLLLAGCTLQQVSQTGIEIPPDPKVATPQFEKQKESEEDEPETVAAEPVKEEKKLAPKKKLKAKVEKKTEVAGPILLDAVPVSKIPFEIGERMEMEMTWTAIPAGKAVLEVRSGEPYNGRPTYWFWGNALSSRIVDTIYHVDNTIESFVDKAGIIPYRFLLHMFESKQKKETRVVFDHPAGKAHYWSKRLSERWGNDQQDRIDSIPTQARDMFSALYYARILNYKLNQLEKFTVYENGQIIDVELLPQANELVTTPVGAFQCWKILVVVKINNVLRPTGDMFLWLSDDSKRYMVRFDAKIKIGTLQGILVSVKERG